MFLQPVDHVEIEQVISSLKNSTAPGKDGISVKIVKLLKEYISKPLAHIINLCFESSVVPKHFKESIVVPIYKAGNKNEMTNFRPISLINSFGKIFEKCLNNRLWSFLNKNNIISKNQFGFQKNIGTEKPLQILISQVLQSFNKNKKTIAIFLDLQKAFDTVSHSKLLEKLNKIGIRGNVLKLFTNYLQDRSQQVRIGFDMSDIKILKTGVPQGTVLGPTLFLIFINSLLYYRRCNILAYADDTVLGCEGESWGEVWANAQLALNEVKTWLDVNHLRLNTSKTKFVAFSPTMTGFDQTMLPLKIVSVNEEVKQTKSIKYLGIFIDQHLKFTVHIDYVVKRLKKLVHRFYTLRNILRKNILLIIYSSLVESLLNYGITVWGATYKTSLRPLQVTQNYIIRAMYKIDSRRSVKSVYVENCLLDIKGLYIVAVMKLMHKVKDDLTKTSHCYSTRRNESEFYTYDRVVKTVCQKSIHFNGVKLYNTLPPEIKTLTNQKFKVKIKQYVVINYNHLVTVLA